MNSVGWSLFEVSLEISIICAKRPYHSIQDIDFQLTSRAPHGTLPLLKHWLHRNIKRRSPVLLDGLCQRIRVLIVSRGGVPKGRSQNIDIRPDTKSISWGLRLAAVSLKFAQRYILSTAKQRYSCHILGLVVYGASWQGYIDTAGETPVSEVT